MARILLVDDSRTSRTILKNLLETDGHIIVGEAVNGEEGVQKYMELSPDLTTMDITMPILDGIGALKKIMQKDKSAKIVMVSAIGQKEYIMEALKNGATEFITKPFASDQILKLINLAVD